MKNSTLELYVVSKSHEKEYEKYEISSEAVEEVK